MEPAGDVSESVDCLSWRHAVSGRPMSEMPAQRRARSIGSIEWWCRLILRSLAASFAIVGSLFFFFPDATIRVMNTVGALFGAFAPAPSSGLRFWLSLGTGYMVLVTALAYVAQRDLRRHRDLVALLALGKATSSLTCLVFYLYASPAFIYLANFVVDGSIALTALAIWLLVPSLPDRLADSSSPDAAPSARPPSPLFAALVETMVPTGGPFPEGGRDPALAADVEAFIGAVNASVPRALRLGLWCLDALPLCWPPRRGHRFSRLPLEDRVHVLEAWERSGLIPLRQLVHTLKLLVMSQFYSRPEIEPRLGDPDPLVRVPRPEPAA